ncbi:DUF58 domain-containing protein [Pseudoalteromonas sp. T1lg22]|uniref:DUF58 domain-containing protein n=1 Tax=Pseudoalteromonas sp. T1lg22 TaxID=2077096 RepID=UPI000CF686FD|nr:DUF58 domain-containing protein [Pseudoalteromonas sp. T1lg22]
MAKWKSALSVQQWLQQLHSNGHSLALKELTYYKSKTQLLDLAVRKRIRSPHSGQYLAPHKGRGMEFAEVRHYQSGDDVRSIDWRVTARTGEAHTKLFQEEKERPVLMLVDFSASMQFGSQLLFKSVQAAHLAALIAWSACARGDKLGALVFNDQQHHEFRPQSRDKAVLRVFHGLLDSHKQQQNLIDSTGSNGSANAPAKGGPANGGPANTGLLAQLQRLNQLAKPGCTVYLLSDFAVLQQGDSPAIERELQRLARHCEVVACVISDPFEQHLPHYPEAVNVRSHQGQFSLPLHDAGFRRRFNQQAQQLGALRQQKLARYCHSLVEITAAKALEQQFYEGSL